MIAAQRPDPGGRHYAEGMRKPPPAADPPPQTEASFFGDPPPPRTEVASPAAAEAPAARPDLLSLLRGRLGFDGDLPFVQAFRVASWMSLALNSLAALAYFFLWLGVSAMGWSMVGPQGEVDTGGGSYLLILMLASLAVVALDWALLWRLHGGRGGATTLVIAWAVLLIQLPVFPLGTLVALAMLPALLHPVTRRVLGGQPRP